MVINASSSIMNLSSNGVRLPSSSRMIPSNGARLPSSSRMIRSNGMRLLRSSSNPCKSIQTLNYGLGGVAVGHGFVNLNTRVRCLRQQKSHDDSSKTNPNSSEIEEESFDGVSDADFFEHFESWCKKYGKTYSSEEEKLRRFNLFKDNYPFKVRDKTYLGLALVNENAADDIDNITTFHTYGLYNDICYPSDPSPVPFIPTAPLLPGIPPKPMPPPGTYLRGNSLFKVPDKTYLGLALLNENAADDNNGNPKTVYAVVTGANKGMGFELCKQLASKGITVVLTARDEKRGLEAVEKLKKLSLPGLVIFHQLDVIDHASIRSFVDFIQNQFGKLDILVNNAGISGAEVDDEALAAANIVENGGQIDWSKTITYEQTEVGIKTNYYEAKDLTEALIPLLMLSSSPKVLNVSSSMGKLEKLPNGWPKEVLNDVENLTEEKNDEVLSTSTYIISKVALSAYRRVAAKKYPSICINAVSPGFVKKDLNYNTGLLTPDEGAESIVRLIQVY